MLKYGLQARFCQRDCYQHLRNGLRWVLIILMEPVFNLYMVTEIPLRIFIAFLKSADKWQREGKQLCSFFNLSVRCGWITPLFGRFTPENVPVPVV
jgi:hypothetical protein